MTMTGTDTGTARETATTAADEAKHVGHVGAEEVQNVAAEAKNQVRTLVDETRTQLNHQSTQQRDRLVATLQTLSLDLGDMAASRKLGPGHRLARQAAQRARDLTSRLDGREPSELLDEVRSFARRRRARSCSARWSRALSRVVWPAGQRRPRARPDRGVPRAGRVDRPGNRLGCEGGHHRAEPSEAEVPRVAPAYSAPYAADTQAVTLPTRAAGSAGCVRTTRTGRLPVMASSAPPRPGPSPQDDRSLGDIVSDVANDLSTLVRQELDLAKTEAKQEASRAGKGAGMLAGAGVAGHLVLLFLSVALMYLLDNWLPVEIAAVLVAALWLVVALVLGSAGRKALKTTNPQLPQTQRSLKEDAEWVKRQKS